MKMLLAVSLLFVSGSAFAGTGIECLATAESAALAIAKINGTTPSNLKADTSVQSSNTQYSVNVMGVPYTIQTELVDGAVCLVSSITRR